MAGTGTKTDTPAAEVDAEAKAAADAKAAEELAEASETEAIGVGELPPEAFVGIEAEADAQLEAETAALKKTQAEEEAETAKAEADAKAVAEGTKVETEPDAKPEVGAETETKTETEAETVAEPAKFDSAAFAKEYGVADADLFSKCKDETEALKVLGRRSGHWSRLFGEQSAEVGRGRQRIEELEAQAAKAAEAKPTETAAPAETTDGAGRVAPEQLVMSAEERQKFLELFDSEPEKAVAQLLARVTVGPDGLTAEQVKTQVQELLQDRDAEHDAQTEREALDAAHPGWKARSEEMGAVAQEYGEWPPIGDCYELAGLRNQDPAAYAKVLAKMQAGYSFADARILVIDHPAAVASPKTVGQTAQQEAERRKQAARNLGPGKNSPVDEQPSSETPAMSVADLEEAGEEF